MLATEVDLTRMMTIAVMCNGDLALAERYLSKKIPQISTGSELGLWAYEVRVFGTFVYCWLANAAGVRAGCGC